MFGSGATILLISSKETNDILKIVESFEEPGLLIKGVKQTIKNKVKEQEGGFIGMLLGTLTLFRMDRGGQKASPYQFFRCNLIPTNIGISPKSFLTFSFNPFATLL